MLHIKFARPIRHITELETLHYTLDYHDLLKEVSWAVVVFFVTPTPVVVW